MRSRWQFALLLFALLLTVRAFGQDAVAYFQSRAFNAPALAGWENQSTDEVAQYYLAEAAATIRTAMVDASDAFSASLSTIANLARGAEPFQLYGGKVNLADGTWHVLVYDIDAATTASIMTRRAGDRFAVVSFIESDPAARTFVLAVPRPADANEELAAQIDDMARSLLVPAPSLEERETTALPSGEWTMLSGPRYRAMGMAFGNDSFIAISDLGGAALPALADAWNRALLGFFITPDNSFYLALGLAAAAAILCLLVLSFVWRARNIKLDLEALESLRRAETDAPSA